MAAISGDGQLDFFGMANGDGVLKDGALPVLHGTAWGRAEALVFSRHLKLGNLGDALEMLGSLNNNGARSVLVQAGFTPRATGGRRAMLESVQNDLIRAARGKMTGVELRQMDEAPGQNIPAAKKVVFPEAAVATSFQRAVAALQGVLSAEEVEIGVAGPDGLDGRQALLFIGGQAIERGVSGFAIEGVAGKFQLPESVDLPGLRAIYGAAGASLAEHEVRSVFPKWAAEKGVPRLSDLVHESTVTLLHGAVSVSHAEDIRTALDNGAVAEFGATQGIKLAGQTLEQQGVRIDAPPLEQLIAESGMRIVNASRGQFVGPVVAQDHRASVVKASRDTAIVVRHKDLPAGVPKPEKGDAMLVKFSGGQMMVNVQKTSQDRGVGGR